MLFDTHAHYSDERFSEDREELLSSMPSLGVSNILNVSCTLADSAFSIGLAERYDFIYAAVGIHPHEAGEEPEENIDGLREAARHPKVVAIGEIGLDYHYDFCPRELQRRFFERQLVLANELSLPVLIHDREAHADCLELVSKHRPKGLFHCYSGSAEMARELVKLGFYISFSGSVTFKNARKLVEAAAAVPPDRLLIETDCPYLAPEPYRGKRNHSGYVREVAGKLSEIHGISLEEMAEVTSGNAKRLFGI